MTTANKGANLTVYPQMEQRTPEWYEARRGIVTASELGRLLTPTLRLAQNATSRGSMLTLAAERITGRVEETYPSRDMERGILDEPLARQAYAEHYGVDVVEVGFMVRDIGAAKIGYSPDGLVGEDGLIEIKSRLPKVQIATVLDDAVPAENMAQLQAGLWVSGRAWIDYISYSGGLPLYVKRVLPDPEWQDAITTAACAAEATITALVDEYTSATKGMPATEYVDHFAEPELRL